MAAIGFSQLRRLVGVLGFVIALTIALTIPLGYGIMAYTKEAEATAFRAQLVATRLARHVQEHGADWFAYEERLSRAMSAPQGTDPSARRRLFDAQGKLLAEQGEPGFLAVKRPAPILVWGVQEGWIELETSLRPALRDGGFVFLFSISLAFSIWTAFRAFPQRALNRALEELEGANEATRLAYDELQEHNKVLLQREEEIRRQNLHFDAALSNMLQGLSLFDGGGRLIVCNRRYLEIFGYSPELVKPGATFRQILEHGAELGHHTQEQARRFLEAKAAQIREGRTLSSVVTLGDGRTVAIDDRPMPGGGWIATLGDVTEVKLAEAQIAEQNEALRQRQEELSTRNLQFDAALNNMSHGLSLFDGEGRLTVCNKRYLEIFGYSPEVVKPGTTYWQILEHGTELGHHSPERAKQFYAAKIAQVCEARAADYLAHLDNGQVIEISHRPMGDGGWVATQEDVTDAKHAEAQIAQQNEALRQREEELGTRTLQFDAALNNMSQGLIMVGPDHRLLVCNRRYLEIFSLSPEVVRPGIAMRDLFKHSISLGQHQPHITADDLLRLYEARSGARKAGTSLRELRDGRTIAISYEPMADGGSVQTFDDITERRRTERRIEEQNKALREREDELKVQNLRFDTALSHMSQGLCMFDADQRLIVCNEHYVRLFGLSPELAAPGTAFRDILAYRLKLGHHPGQTLDHVLAHREAIHADRTPRNFEQLLSDGRVVQTYHQPMSGGGWVSTFDDITERKQAEARISHMARHDALTDLPNRALFRERMEEALAGARRRGQEVGVLCLDLDHFKTVNDTLGHPVGDALLREVAERLRGALREEDVVARFGGDEFAILQVEAKQPEGAGDLARRLVQVVGQPYVLDGHQVNVGASLGIALAPADGEDPNQLLKNADMALYRAKEDGRGTFRFFEPEMDARIQARRALELDLREALVRGEFELHFQPLVNLARGEVGGFEALVRWSHPERGMVSPADFIPVAEEIGLIAPLGDWVLREACAHAARWPAHIKVAVNLSPRQFRTGALVEVVISALASSGLSAERLELEITESVLLDRSEANLAMLHQLRMLGVRISMDDFGTGYSSLSYLRSFPFDKIKIDRSFVQEIESNPDCAAIIRAIASLGETLGMTTTAEGVETKAQLDLVQREGITEVQGYYYSAPKPAGEVLALMAQIGGGVENAA